MGKTLAKITRLYPISPKIRDSWGKVTHTTARNMWGQTLWARGSYGVRVIWGQVCIASRGKVKKLCMEVKVDDSADVYIRALRGSGGSGPTDGGWCNAPGQRRILARASGERNRVRAALCISSTRFPVAMRRMMARLPEESRIRASPARRRTAPLCRAQARAFAWLRSPDAACTSCA